ncbi:hypothetical protein Q3G72_001388 [Acer saccharum]|nr:hypothetical protein Q3G72_001388 [Acer saccharum]
MLASSSGEDIVVALTRLCCPLSLVVAQNLKTQVSYFLDEQKRPLFGGAIATTFPHRFQEVFVDPACDESLIFELLDFKDDVGDNGSAAWFLQDLILTSRE